MYEEYFGLKRQPFRITPDTSLFYDGGQRGDILGALVYAVHRGEGIIKVVGEVGSGKTMLCRMLQLELPDSVEIIYIANPSVSAEDILFVIASELKFNIARDASKHEVMSMLQDYLLKKHMEDKQVVLFVEEAQGMPLETLEEIRLLSNLETDEYKLLQIILFGQPELDANLEKNDIRQLRERITHDFQLKPLTPDQIYTYLNFRMREVGYTGPELISKKLAHKMAVYSQGLLRRINILADKMLLSAFADNTHNLSNKHLQDAVRDSGFSHIKMSGDSNRWIWLLTGLGILLLLALAWGIYQNRLDLKLFKQSISGQNMQQEDSVQTNVPISVQLGENTGIAESHVDEKKQEQPVQLLGETEQSTAEVEVISELQVKADAEELIKIQNLLEKEAITQEPVQATEMTVSSKKIPQSNAKLDKVIQNQAVEAPSSSNKFVSYEEWIKQKLQASKDWLKTADRQGVSIQVMMRSKSASKELAQYLQTDWPLDLDKTYLYEVKIDNRQVYRIFYNEYPTISLGQMEIKKLPESVRVNSPYLHSIYRMQKALL